MISSTDSVPRDVHAGLEQLPTSFRRAKTGPAHNAMLKAVEQEGDTGNAMQLSLDSNGDLAHGRRVEMQHDAENSHHVESCSLRRGSGKTFTRSFLCAQYQRHSIGCKHTAKPIRVQRRLNASPFCSIPDLRESVPTSWRRRRDKPTHNSGCSHVAVLLHSFSSNRWLKEWLVSCRVALLLFPLTRIRLRL